MIFDAAGARERFPLLAERSYLAMQCLGPCPRDMLDDLDAYRLSLFRRNRCLDEWVERLDAIHGAIEALFSAPAGSVFVRDTATAAHAAIASCFVPRGERRRIVTSSADFHSTRYLWHGQAQRGFEIVEIDANGPSHGHASTYLDAIDERTAIVALSLVSPRSGALLDARAVATRAREVGAVLVVDAYQAVGIVPIRVDELGAHVVVGGTHKWLCGGGTGLAFAYVEPALCDTLMPAYPGWIGHASLLGFSDRYVPHAGARKLEQGTPAMEPIYTARAGIAFVADASVDALRARSIMLTERLLARADANGLPIRTPRDPARRGGMICLDVPHPTEIVAALDRQGIDVDYRPGAGIRVGPHPCATEEECDRAIDAIAAELGVHAT